MGASQAIRRTALLAAILLLGSTRPIEGGQMSPPSPPGEADGVPNDSDPTRPVFFSIRPEFYTVSDGVEQRLLIVRYDAAALPGGHVLRSMPGVIMRFEVPLAGADVRGDQVGGVGDAYAQAFVVPYTKSGFALALGSGALLPTATQDLLGSGKLVLAPVVAPVWKQRDGMFFVKIQNFTSVAGEADRPNINHLLVTPLFIHAVGPQWWVLVDSETKTNWTRHGRTGIKSGLQIGHRLQRGVGLWIKPEAWWGPNRDGQWNLKFGLVWYQRPGQASTS